MFATSGGRDPLYPAATYFRTWSSSSAPASAWSTCRCARGERDLLVAGLPHGVARPGPVKVVVNGRVAFEGMVAKDPPVLLKWAARDNDRDVLYAAELPIRP